VSGGACAGAAGPAPGDVRGGRASPGGLKAGGPGDFSVVGLPRVGCGVSAVDGGETFKY